MRHLRFISECHSTAQWKIGLFLPQYPYGLFDWKHCMESERRISIDKALEPTAPRFRPAPGRAGQSSHPLRYRSLTLAMRSVPAFNF